MSFDILNAASVKKIKMGIVDIDTEWSNTIGRAIAEEIDREILNQLIASAAVHPRAEFQFNSPTCGIINLFYYDL